MAEAEGVNAFTYRGAPGLVFIIIFNTPLLAAGRLRHAPYGSSVYHGFFMDATYLVRSAHPAVSRRIMERWV
jgi:hypothetical protein